MKASLSNESSPATKAGPKSARAPSPTWNHDRHFDSFSVPTPSVKLASRPLRVSNRWPSLTR